MTDKFDDWYHSTHSFPDAENYNGAMDAWDHKQEQFENVLERIENYPCCMSCYVTTEEMNAGKAMKETIIKILKDELI